MLVADTYLGSIEESALTERLESEAYSAVTLDDTERRRSRVRTTTDNGTDIGIIVGRELRDGDVLDADGSLVLVTLNPMTAMVLDISGVDGDAATVTEAVTLGHAAGNRHWSLAVSGTEAYLPIADDRDRMEEEIRPLLPDGAMIEYRAVSPTLFDEGRRSDHGHGGDGHTHSGDHHVHDSDNDHHSRVVSGNHDTETSRDGRDAKGMDEPDTRRQDE